MDFGQEFQFIVVKPDREACVQHEGQVRRFSVSRFGFSANCVNCSVRFHAIGFHSESRPNRNPRLDAGVHIQRDTACRVVDLAGEICKKPR